MSEIKVAIRKCEPGYHDKLARQRPVVLYVDQPESNLSTAEARELAAALIYRADLADVAYN